PSGRSLPELFPSRRIRLRNDRRTSSSSKPDDEPTDVLALLCHSCLVSECIGAPHSTSIDPEQESRILHRGKIKDAS
ncbi:MAG: hypothetical protein M1830_002349, partial [Pleopsidium flavum]